MELDLGDVEIGGFLKSGIVYKCSPNQLLSCNHITQYGTGLVWSLCALVQGASYYIRVCRTSQSGLSQVVGNSVVGLPIGYPSGGHLGFPTVALEWHSKGGTAGMCRGGKLHRVGTCTKVDRWRASIDYLNPAYLCMMVPGGIPVDLSNGVGKVYKLCRV
jgi:hypothetical protein